MLFEKNVHGDFLDAPDIQSSGTGLKICQGVCVREDLSAATACSLSLSQQPGPSTQPGFGKHHEPSQFLLLILALSPLPSHAGKFIIGFFLYPKMLNPGKIKAGP